MYPTEHWTAAVPGGAASRAAQVPGRRWGDTLQVLTGIERWRGALAGVLAHPGDETVGLGSLLPRSPDLSLVHVMDGAPREELLAALKIAGVGASRLWSLGLAAQEASGDLVGLTARVLVVLRELHASVVLTHPYEGVDPDHDATAFAVHAAVRLLRRGGAECPRILEFTAPHHGPAPSAGKFIPHVGRDEVSIVLGERERSLKRRMLGCFVSQRTTLTPFQGRVERFRIAPRYDFRRPPHPGPLRYECGGGAVTGEEWRFRAAAALEALRIG